jgi:hypothetical protein
MLGLQEQLADMLSGRLPEVVRAALGEPGAALGGWDAAALKGRFGAPLARCYLNADGKPG